MESQASNETKPLDSTNTSSDVAANLPDNEASGEMAEQKSTAAISLARSSVCCRICLNNGESGRLLTPCECKGTQGFVHRDCLEYWLSRSGLSHCELCKFRFHTVDYLRYGLWESLGIWFRHPSHRALLQSDILVCSLLTLISIGTMLVLLFGMHILAVRPLPAEESEMYEAFEEETKYWTRTSIAVFLGIVIFAFVLNTVAVIRTNFVPWFRWWRRCKQIHLIFEPTEGDVQAGRKSLEIV